MAIIVIGAGVGGLSASIALARAGHDVVVLERDAVLDDGTDAMLNDARPGCPQRNQGHSFLAHAWRTLEQNAPDILASLIAAGGNITDGNLALPPEHHDDDLRALAIRRSLIDRTLLVAARAESRITFEHATVNELIAGPARDGIPSVTGVRTADGRTFSGDLVVDASGRRSPIPTLLPAIGARTPVERSSPCGLIYFGRYFEMHPETPEPPRISPAGVRATLGYLGYAVFWQDARVFIIGLNPEADDRAMRALYSEHAFMAAARSIRHLAPFVEEGFAMPRGPVVAMGGLHNMRRSFVADGAPLARGLVVIGDGLCHTDPTPAYGMSMAMAQAFLLPSMLSEAGGAVAVALEDAVGPELDDRFEQASRANAERLEIAKGRRPNPETDTEYVIENAWLALARTDPGVLRRYLRRVLAADLPSVLSRDEDFMAAARAAIVESGVLDKTRRPTREELIEIMADADQTSASNAAR